jgi:hypothetical protein
MTNFGKHSVIIFASETPTRMEIANALRAALQDIGSVLIADTVSPDNIRQLNTASKTITLNVKDVTLLKGGNARFIRNELTKSTGMEPGRSWKS